MPDANAELRRIFNELSIRELTGHYGVAAAIAREIVAHRPYHSEVDILERAILPKRTYEQLVTHIIEVLGSDEAA